MQAPVSTLFRLGLESLFAFCLRPLRHKASALFGIWTRGEGCLCICRCLLNIFDSTLYSKQQGTSAAPHGDSLWQQLLTVSKSLNMVCVFSEVIAGWLFKMVTAVCTELPAEGLSALLLLQKNLQGREREGVGRIDWAELDWYLDSTVSRESKENESLWYKTLFSHKSHWTLSHTFLHIPGYFFQLAWPQRLWRNLSN